MFFRFETEGVNIDTGGRDIGVVLVRLDKVEVSAISFGETIVTVKLEFGGVDTVFTGVEERKSVEERTDSGTVEETSSADFTP